MGVDGTVGEYLAGLVNAGELMPKQVLSKATPTSSAWMDLPPKFTSGAKVPAKAAQFLSPKLLGSLRGLMSREEGSQSQKVRDFIWTDMSTAAGLCTVVKFDADTGLS